MTSDAGAAAPDSTAGRARQADGAHATAPHVRALAPHAGDNALIAFATLVLFTLLAGDFWRDLIGWLGWGLLAGFLSVGCVVYLVVRRPSRDAASARMPLRKAPKALALFLLLALVSIAWSFYPVPTGIAFFAQTATTAAGAFLALRLSWAQILRALGAALRWAIGLSLLFELIVAVFVRHPVLPLVHQPGGDYSASRLPQAFYWSRDLLLHGGQIQGIVGNSNLLAMIALLALIVFGVQLRDRTVHPVAGVVWLALAVATFALTRSSTIIIAAAVVAAVLGFAAWTRHVSPARRVPVYLTAAVAFVVVAASTALSWGIILRVFGKSEDLTGRVTIWQEVIGLAGQRPVFGWGWVSYWAPWVEPFKNLAERNGVVYLQAHDAWLDVWLQLGIIGVVVFAALVLTTVGRAWFAAVDRPRKGLDSREPFTALSMLPLLVLAALIAQSLAESRMLVEGGWALLVLFCIKTKVDRA
ncbi:MAG TPA: O-antigen ligase family protein [Humibacter sp.]|nr:O-antigen ligase family protein [Humibacter sp.]